MRQNVEMTFTHSVLKHSSCYCALHKLNESLCDVHLQLPNCSPQSSYQVLTQHLLVLSCYPVLITSGVDPKDSLGHGAGSVRHLSDFNSRAPGPAPIILVIHSPPPITPFSPHLLHLSLVFYTAHPLLFFHVTLHTHLTLSSLQSQSLSKPTHPLGPSVTIMKKE